MTLKQRSVQEFLETDLGKEVLGESKRWLVTLITGLLGALLAAAAVYAPSLLNLDPDFAQKLSTTLVETIFLVALNGGAFVIGRTIRDGAVVEGNKVVKETLKESKRWLVTVLTMVITSVVNVLGTVLPEFVTLPPEMAGQLATAATDLAFTLAATSGVFVVARSVRPGAVKK